MTVFALVHGAWHGGWVWERLVPELEARGHTAIAPDLPCEDPTQDASGYARHLTAALADAGDDVVLVGHSLGGLTAPLVAAQRPVRRLVLLAALLPEPGRSLIDQLKLEPGILLIRPREGLQVDDDKRTRWRDAEIAARALYTDCPVMLAAAAFARLRWQASAPDRQKCPLERWPDVPTEYIVCAQDRTVSPAWGVHAARERLGVSARELPGGHSPMLSRPAELAELLCAPAAVTGP